MPSSSSWGAILHLAANSLFVYYLCLVLFPQPHHAKEDTRCTADRDTSTASITETRDATEVSFADADELCEQQQLPKRQQQPRRSHVQTLSTTTATPQAQAAYTADRRSSLGWERPITVQQLRDFVHEVRHQPALLPPRPRGFRNPWNLCYRNAVVVALLHSRRFVAFLHVYARRSSGGDGDNRVGGTAASALLTRFHALAAAYWEAGGGSGSGSGGDDRCETLHALLWRACNDSSSRIGGRPCRSWQAVCREQDLRLLGQDMTTVAGGSDEANSSSTSLGFWEQQQDAVAFWDWLVERARAQLLAAPSPRDSAADWFGAMFDVRLETRWWATTTTTTTTTTRQVGIKVPVGAEGEETTNTLDGLLAAFFCDGQGRQRRQWRLLLAAPELLPVHLMRVGNDAQGRPVIKHRTAVAVPELLDVSRWLAPHVFAAGSRVVYRLSTVVSHRGRDAQSGHYVAHVRTGSKGSEGSTGSGWARVDDHKVTLGVPFGQVTGATGVSNNNNNNNDNDNAQFDPVLLVYEKWIEQYSYSHAGSCPTATATTARRRRRRWREDDATTGHADEPAAKKPRS